MPALRLVLCCACAVFAMASARAQSIIATASTPGGTDVAINATTNRIYVAGDYANVVTVIDGASNATAQVPVGYRPQFIAVNTATNKIYSSNTQDGTLSVIDGTSHAVINLPIGGAGPIAINERTNKIYVIRRGNNGEVTVVDGATHTWYSISTGSYVPEWQVVNSATSRLYVSHSTSGDVRAIDTSSASDHPPTVGILVAGRPTYIALNTVTNKVYVLSDDSRGPIVAIDGATNASQRIATPGHSGVPMAIAVNPSTNRVYAAIGNEVVVVDGASHAVSYLATGNLSRLAVDAAQNRIYGIRGNLAVVAIDGATQGITQIPVPTQAFAIAANPVTHRVYAVAGTTSVIEGGAAAQPQDAFGLNAQGLWWASPAAVESGWGLNIAHQGNTIFATWFTYDTDGSALWLVMPNGARTGSANIYTGDVYRTTGPAFGAAFDPSKVTSTPVGTASLSMLGPDNAVFAATINGSQIYKSITRQIYGAPVPTCAAGGSAGAQPNYQDIWWNSPAGNESGWGLYVTHQGDNLFVTWFTYGADGKAMWLVGSNVRRRATGCIRGRSTVRGGRLSARCRGMPSRSRSCPWGASRSPSRTPPTAAFRTPPWGLASPSSSPGSSFPAPRPCAASLAGVAPQSRKRL